MSMEESGESEEQELAWLVDLTAYSGWMHWVLLISDLALSLEYDIDMVDLSVNNVSDSQGKELVRYFITAPFLNGLCWPWLHSNIIPGLKHNLNIDETGIKGISQGEENISTGCIRLTTTIIWLH